PMAVIYALDGHQARIYERLGRPPVSLPNIILGRDVVPELVAADLTPETVAQAALSLLADKKARQDQIDAFGELADLMEAGWPHQQKQELAERVLAEWRNQREAIG